MQYKVFKTANPYNLPKYYDYIIDSNGHPERFSLAEATLICAQRNTERERSLGELGAIWGFEEAE